MVKGNVLDLAVAFVMGAAFNSVVTALVTDIVTPLIGVPGHVNFANIIYTVGAASCCYWNMRKAVRAVLGCRCIRR